MIRFIVGLLIVFGAVGTLDVDPQASVVVSGLIALGGLSLAAAGVARMQRR